MLISRYICLFIIYSVMGWIYETLFCTIKNGKWENRGFLYGPICPIYGTGAVAISLIISFALGRGITFEVWEIFIIAVFGSAILEYVTSWVLEKLFHAVWWDYSNLPLNIHGRISLFTSLGFGIGGLLIVYIIAPFTEGLIIQLSSLAIEILALIYIFIFAVDLTLTVTALLHFDRMVKHMDDNFNKNMDSLVNGAVNKTNQIKQGIVGAKNYADTQLQSMSDFVRTTIKRASSFRDNDKKKETIKNQLLSLIRQAKNTLKNHNENSDI